MRLLFHKKAPCKQGALELISYSLFGLLDHKSRYCFLRVHIDHSHQVDTGRLISQVDIKALVVRRSNIGEHDITAHHFATGGVEDLDPSLLRSHTRIV